mgnify:CR=1 FL=1|jgi:hypothetical protein
MRLIGVCSNMTYHFGIGERAKERVDKAGHVVLTTSETWKLSRTKVFSTTITVIGITVSVQYGSPFGSVLIATVATLLCKLSELLSMPEAKLSEKSAFLAIAVGSQLGGFVLFVAIIVAAENGL